MTSWNDEDRGMKALIARLIRVSMGLVDFRLHSTLTDLRMENQQSAELYGYMMILSAR